MPIVKSLGSALVCVGGHRREAGGRSRRGGARERGDYTRKQSRAGAPRALGASDRTGCAWRRAVCGLLPCVGRRPHASLLSHCWPRSRVGGTRVAFGVFAPWPWPSARCTEARERGGAGSPSRRPGSLFVPPSGRPALLSKATRASAHIRLLLFLSLKRQNSLVQSGPAPSSVAATVTCGCRALETCPA